MFLKRTIIQRLDEYEDILNHLSGLTNREAGITQGAFIGWFLEEEKKLKKHEYQRINKYINDCIEDGYINRIFVDGELSPEVSVSDFGMFLETKMVRSKIENISLSSKGRDLKHWYFFWPAMIERMSAKEIILFAITTATFVLLGYLGLRSF